MKTYRLSAAGRRTTLVLLVGALLIWAFAIWTLRSTLVAAPLNALLRKADTNLPLVASLTISTPASVTTTSPSKLQAAQVIA